MKHVACGRRGLCLTVRRNAREVRLVSAAGVLALAASASAARGGTYGEQMNPTGDPTGGGPGYRDVKRPDDADHVVVSKEELLGAIGRSTTGQTIYVADSAEIDLTGVDMVEIPGAVTLASGRGRDGSLGALLYSDSRYPNGEYRAMFVTGGEHVRLTGLRFRGPDGDYGDHHYERLGVACCIRDVHGSLEIDNCELSCWNKWAVYLDKIGKAHVHHNYIHHTRRAGYGYGVWVADGGEALIEANLFDFNRHHIGSGAQVDGSYEARHNLCLYHDTNPSFDRHGGSGRAGNWTRIHHNTFRNTQVEAILLRAPPVGGAEFHHNWFYHRAEAQAFDIDRAQGVRVSVRDNHYGPVPDSELPMPRAEVTAASGVAPLTVAFDATASQPDEGSRLTTYEWNFGDEPGPVGTRAYGPKVSHTFEHPGRYPVELRVANDRGITNSVWVSVTVSPPSPGRFLSVWLKDSNRSDVPGYYRKQILLDAVVVWEDDTAGDEQWERVLVDVTTQLQGRTEATLAFRLLCDKQVTDTKTELVEIFFYIDDVHLFGGEVRNGGCEDATEWIYSEAPADSTWRGLPWRGEARTGKSCYTLEIPYSRTAEAGSYCQISQRVKLRQH